MSLKGYLTSVVVETLEVRGFACSKVICEEKYIENYVSAVDLKLPLSEMGKKIEGEHLHRLRTCS